MHLSNRRLTCFRINAIMEIMSSSTTTSTPFQLKQLYNYAKKYGYYRFDFSNDERWEAMLKAVNAKLQEVSQIPTLEIEIVDRKSRWMILPMPLNTNKDHINKALHDLHIRIVPVTKTTIERHRLNNLKSRYPKMIVQAATHEKLLELEKKSVDSSSESKIVVNSTNVREVAGLIINTLNFGSGTQTMCQTLSLKTDDEFNPKPTKEKPKPKPNQAFRNLQNYIVTQKQRSDQTKKNLKHLWADEDVRYEVRDHFCEDPAHNSYDARFSFTKRFWDDGSFKQYVKYKLYGYYKLDRADLEWLWVTYVDYKYNADHVWCEESMISFKEYLDQVAGSKEYFTNFTARRSYNIAAGDLLRFCYDCLAKGKVNEEIGDISQEVVEEV